ncbi:MAG: nucleoside deaminase [Ignavibacteriae bacterium]|nr:nucleoside deaminase [Ignavibacteriota bacterium]
MKNSFRSYVIITLIVLSVLFGFQVATYKSASLFRDDVILSDSLLNELRALATTALQHKDAPIAALILYKGKIIGRGYNTVLRDINVGGHAEINALSDALHTFSRTEFALLEKDSLFLISTYEPCLMCQGAILEYNIKHVQFLKEKSILHWLKEDYRSYRYQWRRVQVSPNELQDSLFRLHPDYKE